MPNSPASENTSYLSVSGCPHIKEVDSNYVADWEQLCKLKINNVGSQYFLGSRYKTGENTGIKQYYYAFRTVDSSGNLNTNAENDFIFKVRIKIWKFI